MSQYRAHHHHLYPPIPTKRPDIEALGQNLLTVSYRGGNAQWAQDGFIGMADMITDEKGQRVRFYPSGYTDGTFSIGCATRSSPPWKIETRAMDSDKTAALLTSIDAILKDTHFLGNTLDNIKNAFPPSADHLASDLGFFVKGTISPVDTICTNTDIKKIRDKGTLVR